jgi:GntR family transcriptional repressor for pyruvate dehydrogenase complex
MLPAGLKRDAPDTLALLDQPVHSTATYELVVERLRQAIHLGEYGPGDRLPSERDLAERLNISRVTLREAIRVLEGEGYLQTSRGSAGGARVVASRLSQDEIRASLLDRLDELEGMLDFREANEALAARRAARLRSADELAELQASLTTLGETSDHATFRREDSRFHATVARAARLPVLARVVHEVRAAMFMPIDALEFDLILHNTLRGHRGIVKAIEAGNGAAAARAMARHIAQTRDDLHDVLK